jgi:hypothetical protein
LLSAIVIAYFDTQTFDHMYKKIGCTGADIANLRKAIYGRQLSIRLSIHTLEEILLGRKVSPQAFAAQIKLTLSLASSRSLVKPCYQLVLDDIRAFAARGNAERPFLDGSRQNAVAEGIASLIESDGEEVEDDFVAVLDEARQEKQHFFTMLEHAQTAADAFSKAIPRGGSFDQDLDAAALPLLEIFSEQAGVSDACRERGFHGLLELKSVRVSVGAAFAASSLQGGDRAIDLSTAYHAISAAAVAQIYVSDNGANRELLSRSPIEGFTITSLPEFLTHL